MSAPSLIAKGCTLDLTLDARKRLPFLRLAPPLQVVPTPPSHPPSHVTSRHFAVVTRSPVSRTRPSAKAACHQRRKTSVASSSTDKLTDKDSGSLPVSREATVERSDSLKLHDVLQAADDSSSLLTDLNISNDLTKTDGRKTKRRKKNHHRKSKSKHRLKSARGSKTTKEFESEEISPSHVYAPPLQAFCAPVKIGSQPKKAEKPKVEYVHIRAKSQPERASRKSTIVTPPRLPDRTVLSASVESLGRVRQSASKTISPYGILHQKHLKEQEVVKRCTKIYLSDRQSKNLKELGMEFPGAPPATPLPDTPSSGSRPVEYVSSLADVRSQRAVRERLAVLERAEHVQQERVRENRQQQEKLALAELRREKRRMQRRQVLEMVGAGGGKKKKGSKVKGKKEEDIRSTVVPPFERRPYRKPTGIEAQAVSRIQRKKIYALNAVMKELENKNFKEFCTKNGIRPKL